MRKKMNNMEKLKKFLREELGLETDEQVEEYFEFLEEQRGLHPPIPEGHCYFCGKETFDEDLCYGCKKHICPDCMGPFELVPMGPHTIDAHKAIRN